jgi:hypothetical protein
MSSTTRSPRAGAMTRGTDSSPSFLGCVLEKRGLIRGNDPWNGTHVAEALDPVVEFF